MVKKAEKTDEITNETIDLRPMPMAPACGPGSAVVGVYRLTEETGYPAYQTDAAGCFDLAADLGGHIVSVKFWDTHLNRQGDLKVRSDSTGRYILLQPGDRALIPTGLVFAFPIGFSMNTFIRSSVGLKKGLQLANSVGYIDEDYRGELMLPIINTSKGTVRIDHKERLAQGEVRAAFQAIIEPLDERPSVVGNRNGGFGSTGYK